MIMEVNTRQSTVKHIRIQEGTPCSTLMRAQLKVVREHQRPGIIYLVYPKTALIVSLILCTQCVGTMGSSILQR